jgi:hypothetical protein
MRKSTYRFLCGAREYAARIVISAAGSVFFSAAKPHIPGVTEAAFLTCSREERSDGDEGPVGAVGAGDG